MVFSRWIGCALVAVTAVGCSSSSSPRRANGPYPGQFQPQGGQAQGLPELQRPVSIGSAFTGFGVVINQIPTLAWPLPPLPGGGGEPQQTGTGTNPQPGGWSLPWPTSGLPIPLPFPGANPQPTQPTDGWPGQWQAWEDEVLARTNAVRARGVVCGNQQMPPAGPVQPHGALRNSARGHSRDMANRNFFDHTNPEGMGPGQRARGAGFSSSFVGENIAAGQTDPARVVQAWIDSPGHCVNMMDPRYKFLGVGYFFEGGDRFEHYWTQNFGG